jgi:hypothetical protein
MEELARRFRLEARGRRGLRYPPGLRRVAVEYATAAERGGRSQQQIAASLGLCKATLARWRRLPVATSAIHAVKVVALPGGRAAAGGCVPACGAVLVMPSGVRVEGLGLAELVHLLVEVG